MKRLLSALIFAILLPIITLFTACSGEEAPIGEDNTSSITVDLDYSKFSDTVLLDTINNFYSKEFNEDGKTVKIRAEFGAYFNSSENDYRSVIEKFDNTACCAAFYELRLEDGVARPTLGSRIELVGKFVGSGESGYISVSAITLFSGSYETALTELDASSMSAADMKLFVSEASKVNNAHTGKTVRICGHFGKNAQGLSFLVGYKTNPLSGKLETSWSIELHSDSVEFPELDGTYLNAYEIIGTVSSYTLGEGVYPCIEVISIQPISNFTAG